MSTLVEMIEALQKEWRECAKSQVPRAYADRGMEDKYLKLDNWASGMDEAANDLAPILAAAREREKELAEEQAAHQTIATICFQAGVTTDDGTSVSCVRNLAQELAAMKEQHSADLREVAEMAIAAMRQYQQDLSHWGAESDVDEVDAPERPTADSILAAFREKQQKSKGGDACESSKSSQPDQR